MKKILIVDDSVAFADLMELVFNKEFEIHKAHDGAEGVESALRLKPDLILLDVMLPRLSGIEVLRRLQSAGETGAIPVIILTAHYFEPQLQKILQREPNVAAFLSKACGTQTLLAEIHQALGEPL